MVLEDRNETLSIMFPPVQSTYGTGEWGASNGYAPLGPDGLIYKGNIDLSGYSQESLTFATMDTAYQDPGIYSQNDAAGSEGTQTKLEVIEMITDVPFNNTALQILINDMGVTVPGMLSTLQDHRQIIYGRYSLYVPNTTLGLPGYFQLVSAGGLGSKEPTAASKLYCYTCIRVSGPGTPQANETVQLPASRCGLYG